MRRKKSFWALIALVMTFFVASHATAQGNYLVQVGDTLNIEVLEDNSLNRSVVVLPDGRFSFPFAGTVRAQGRSIGQIETAIRASISSNFANEPNVFVSVIPRPEREQREDADEEEIETIQVFFIGEIGSPGLKLLPEGTTLLQSIALTGGFSRFAATKRLQLRRPTESGEQKIFQINYKAIANGANLTDITLQEGDVILVPERRLFE